MDLKKLVSTLNKNPDMEPDPVPYDPNSPEWKNIMRFALNNLMKDQGYGNMMPVTGAAKAAAGVAFDPENAQHLKLIQPYLEKLLPSTVDNNYADGQLLHELLTNGEPQVKKNVLQVPEVKQAIQQAGFDTGESESPDILHKYISPDSEIDSNN